MKFNTTALALVLIGALTANAVNLRSNSSGQFPACPQGGWTYSAVNSHCYKAFPKESAPAAPASQTTEPYLKADQWEHARKRCAANYDAYIAVPNNDAENTFIRGMITSNNNEEFFLGYDQAGLIDSKWLDDTKQSASWRNPSTATGYGDTATPIRLPAGLKQAFKTTTGNLPWVPVTGTKVKPVLVMKSDGSWKYEYKHEDLPFVCELVFCTHGCNDQEKSPAPKNSANTIVADSANVNRETNPHMSR